jgi:16S rRNA (cytidine1402-2'-O)-methyltransferase
MSAGKLVLVPTPIGNLGDVTLRALEVLKAADVLACEDTRHTRKLLSRYEIHTKLVSYHRDNEAKQGPYLLERIRSGDTVALVSDAGTPGIADPGERLVAAVLADGLAVEALPGPSAVITALVQSGLPAGAFSFLGWVPRAAKERSALIGRLETAPDTSILYESPKRLAAALATLAAALPDRPAAIARELTKLHEEVLRGTLGELAVRVAAAGEVKGEIVLMVAPAEPAGPGVVDAEALAAVAGREAVGESTRDAVRAVAADLGLSRRTLYEEVMRERRRS